MVSVSHENTNDKKNNINDYNKKKINDDNMKKINDCNMKKINDYNKKKNIEDMKKDTEKKKDVIIRRRIVFDRNPSGPPL